MRKLLLLSLIFSASGTLSSRALADDGAPLDGGAPPDAEPTASAPCVGVPDGGITIDTAMGPITLTTECRFCMARDAINRMIVIGQSEAACRIDLERERDKPPTVEVKVDGLPVWAQVVIPIAAACVAASAGYLIGRFAPR